MVVLLSENRLKQIGCLVIRLNNSGVFNTGTTLTFSSELDWELGQDKHPTKLSFQLILVAELDNETSKDGLLLSVSYETLVKMLDRKALFIPLKLVCIGILVCSYNAMCKPRWTARWCSG